MTFEVVPVPDELLMRVAAEKGSRCNEARILEQIRSERAQDRQTFAFRCGSVWFLGSTPDAETEQAMIEFARDLHEGD